MNVVYRGLVLSVLACALSLSAGERPNKKGEGDGPGGPGGKRVPEIDFILDHAKELNLTADQIKKINEQKNKIEDRREKMMKDPANKELYKEMMAARKSGDEDKLRELREKVKEKMAAGGGAGEDMRDEFVRILTPEQLAKLKEIRETEGPGMRKGERGGPGGKGGGEGQKPDPKKGVPSLFDNEK